MRIYNVFYILLLDQDITRKEQADENAIILKTGNSKEYKVETIWDSAVYTKKSELNYLLGIYYLVFWKNYLKKKNICKPYLIVQHFKKLINLFYKDYLNKPTAISKIIDTVLPIAKPIIKFSTKKKQSQLTNSTNNK